MKAISIRGVDQEISERLKYLAKVEGKSVNCYLVDLIKQDTETKKRKKFSKRYDDLDHFFGRWSAPEFEKIHSSVDDQRRIDPELWK